MVLGPGGVARRAVRVRRSGKNSLEHFNEFDDAHFEPGFFGKLARDALLERFSHFQQAAGDGPFALERRGRRAGSDRARPSSITTPPTPTMGWSGYSLLGVIVVFGVSLPGRFALYNTSAARAS